MQAKGRFPGFWGRFRFYLLGLAIGCTLMGFFQLAKKNEARQREAAAERARTEEQNNPLFPPLPEAERAKQAQPGVGTPVGVPTSPAAAGSSGPK